MKATMTLLMTVGLLYCAAELKAEYPIQSVPFVTVKMTDTFWQPRLETNRVVTIPHVLRECEDTGRIDNFRVTAGIVTGTFQGLYFNDSDLYKSIESVGYSLSNRPDAKLEAYADTLVRLIALAQQTNGYLYNLYSVREKSRKWTDVDRMHELYCAGHFFEAADAYYRATGKREILDIAKRLAAHIRTVFGPGKKTDPPGHEEIEIGLVKLYRLTGDTNYLNLAEFFIDQRGRAQQREQTGRRGRDLEYNQNQDLVTNQNEAVGHAVRATYLYSGMADVVAQAAGPGYMNVLTSIWDDIAARKLYITGGIGAQGGGESFGSPYFLPNERSYCETCASIAFVLFNQRMFQLTGDAKYIDMLERSLYNALLAGYAITGEKFFYPNPLASSGRHERSEWFECACCPPNVARFIATVPGYMYATKGNTVYVNLYGASVMHTVMGDVPVEITQKTEYPWEGAITLSVKPAKEVNGALALRIPGWARNEVMPGDLYLFEKESMQQPEISINGEKADLKIQSGYAIVKRDWKAGDTIEMQLPMPVRRIWSNPAIRTNKDLAAFQRGPIVYCAEWPDNSKHVFDLCLPVGTELKPEYNPELFNGIMTLKGKAELIYYPEGSTNTAKAEQEVTLIPYYAWAHRGRGEMAVWLAEKETVARPVQPPTIASESTVSASVTGRRSRQGLRGINNQEDPLNSTDWSSGMFGWWPQTGTVEWVQYDFAAETNVSAAEVYWFYNPRFCDLPVSWRLLYREGDEWKPVKNKSGYELTTNRYVGVKFEPVTTPGLRLEVELQPEKSSAILEWKVK